MGENTSAYQYEMFLVFYFSNTDHRDNYYVAFPDFEDARNFVLSKAGDDDDDDACRRQLARNHTYSPPNSKCLYKIAPLIPHRQVNFCI